ncbi:thiamine biosynthesis lipoprotein [Motilibacter peucedani]|uniref:FAD:protein FMN transferase n=1 Tax=Motilibacter peucedani TaxID=598650 RepID=A0A420XQE8_9ACTN|nr:FAD:protein FMN transferase [Motilibacter peucedani]RKS75479.1 thiamine biosynthesis lipoprotein [Motilibacter peucedani]
MTALLEVPAAHLPRRAWVEQVMGLPVSVHVRGENAGSGTVEQAVADLYAELRRADARFSTYRDDSEVMARRRGEAPVPSAQMAEVLELCDEARRRTHGAFDAELPGGFDPSGLVKGWAVERAAERLREAARGSDWLVNAGGDIVLRAEEGRTWQVAIEDPRDPARTLRTFALSDGAVATSGAAHRGAHIVDPRTGRPAAQQVLSATVLAPSLLWADVYATAAYVGGVDSLSWLAPAATQVLLVRGDGSLISSRQVAGRRVRPWTVPLARVLG